MPKILLASMPKAGTHLMASVLSIATGLRATSVGKGASLAGIEGPALRYGHVRYGQVSGTVDWRVLVLIRDPRDVVLSMRDHLRKGNDPRHAAMWQSISHRSNDDQLIAVIQGMRVADARVAPINVHCSGWLEWQRAGAPILRYEDIMTGSATRAIADAISANPHDVADSIAQTIGKSTATFNVGKPYRWRTEMSQRVLDHFYAVAPSLAVSMGY
jgi:hypothetical protein